MLNFIFLVNDSTYPHIIIVIHYTAIILISYWLFFAPCTEKKQVVNVMQMAWDTSISEVGVRKQEYKNSLLPEKRERDKRRVCSVTSINWKQVGWWRWCWCCFGWSQDKAGC